MSDLLRVAVVDDHPLFRDGVTRTLNELGFNVVAQGSSAEEAESIAAAETPDLLLLDISMPGGGLTTIPTILRAKPDIKIVMLTASEDGDHLRQALQLGASGYVLKGTGAQDLAQILLSISQGERYVPPGLSARLLSDTAQASDNEGLSRRESEVMDLVATGSSNKVVARQLGLQEKTVKRHMTSILAKLGASNRTEAALTWSKMRGDTGR
jgi:two-component system, NarL family, nitrate/nitrite response regulator NarL